MVGTPLISLCARVVPELSPAELIGTALDTGYGAVSFAFDSPYEFDDRMARDLRARLDNNPIECLDVNVIRIMPGPENPDHYRFIDFAADIGAKHVLVVIQDPNFGPATERFSALCEHAATRGVGVVLEFMIFTDCKTLNDAYAIVRDAGQPNGRILIDTLHIARAGHKPEDIADYDPALFPFIQLSDAPASIDLSDDEAYLFDARQGRLAPGEGELPLREMLRFIDPIVPIGLEVLSDAYIERYPDAFERARFIFERTKRFLRDAESKSTGPPAADQ